MRGVQPVVLLWERKYERRNMSSKSVSSQRLVTRESCCWENLLPFCITLIFPNLQTSCLNQFLLLFQEIIIQAELSVINSYPRLCNESLIFKNLVDQKSIQRMQFIGSNIVEWESCTHANPRINFICQFFSISPARWMKNCTTLCVMKSRHASAFFVFIARRINDWKARFPPYIKSLFQSICYLIKQNLYLIFQIYSTRWEGFVQMSDMKYRNFNGN